MAKRKTKIEARGEHNICKGADLTGYVKVKAASGRTSLDCADNVARQLRGATLDHAYKVAAKALGESQRTLRQRYAHLNPGQQRMVVGNLLRGAAK